MNKERILAIVKYLRGNELPDFCFGSYCSCVVPVLHKALPHVFTYHDQFCHCVIQRKLGIDETEFNRLFMPATPYNMFPGAVLPSSATKDECAKNFEDFAND